MCGPVENGNLSHPQRRKPASGVFVSLQTPTIVFLTVCTKNRAPWLAQPESHALLVDVWRQANAWAVGRYLLMPDHVHLFCSPADLSFSLDQWVTYWKRSFTRAVKNAAWAWQSHKWDTRLRREENYQDKWEYVRMNPVRKGLVSTPDEWPFQGTIHDLRW